MATPTSDIQLCNLALDRLGQREISSISSPTTEPENICSRHYDMVRRALLRRFIFNFAKKYTVLTQSLTKTPAFGYTAAYALPNDFIRVLALGDSSVNADISSSLYLLSEGYIFTDYGDSGSLNMEYIYDAKNVSAYDPLFVQLFVLHLAAAMAYKFSLKNTLISAIRQDADDVALAAAAVSGQEKPPRRIQRSKIKTARRMGIKTYDNRYI